MVCLAAAQLLGFTDSIIIIFEELREYLGQTVPSGLQAAR